MRDRFHTLVIGAAVLAVSAFAPLAAQDDVSQVRIVRLSFIQGDVALQPTGESVRTARLYDPVQEGFLLRTEADSFAEVEFENGSTARLGEDSEIFFEQLALSSPSGAKLNRLSLGRGYATFNIDLGRGDVFELEAQGTEVELDESAHFRVDLDSPQTHIKVFDGRAIVEGPTGRVEVEANKTLTLNPEGDELIELRSGITEDAWDRWNRERDNLRALQARGGTLGGAPYNDRHYDDGHVYSTHVYHDHHTYHDDSIYYSYPYRYGYPYFTGHYGHVYYPYRSGFGIHIGLNFGRPYRHVRTGFGRYPWRFSSSRDFHFSRHHRLAGIRPLRRKNFGVPPVVPRLGTRRLRSRIFLNRTLSGGSAFARGERTRFGLRRTNFATAGTVRTTAVSSVTPVFGGGNRRARNAQRVGTGSRSMVRNRGNQPRRSRVFLSRGTNGSNAIVFDRETRTFTNGPAAATSNSRSQTRRRRQLRQARGSSQVSSSPPSRVQRARRNSNLNTRPGQRGSLEGRSLRGSSRIGLRSNQDRDSRVSASRQGTNQGRRFGRGRNSSRNRSARARPEQIAPTSAGTNFSRSQRLPLQDRVRRLSSRTVARSSPANTGTVNGTPAGRTSRSRRFSASRTSVSRSSNSATRSRAGSPRPSRASTSARGVRTPQRALARTRSSARAQSFSGNRYGASRPRMTRNSSSSRSRGRSRAFSSSPSRNSSGASRTSTPRSYRSGARSSGPSRSFRGGGRPSGGSSVSRSSRPSGGGGRSRGGGGSRGGRGGGGRGRR